MSIELLFAKDEPDEAAKPVFVTGSNVAYQALDKSRLDDMPYVEAQEELELMFDKCQLKSRIKKELDIPDFDRYLSEQGAEHIPRDFALALCTQMIIHKRCSPSTMIGILYHMCDDGHGSHVAMQTCSHLIEEACKCDLLDYNSGRDELIVRLNLEPSTEKELDMFQYPLPMVVQPKKLNHNHQSGYRTKVAGGGMVVLKPGKMAPFYGQADLCLDHLNRMNAIPLTLNTRTAELIENSWKDLDRRKPNETPSQYEKRVKAFERYDESSKDVMHALQGIRSRFWLTHKYDRRGRVYCQGYHINYQGNPWNKAVIEFADKELIE